MDADEDEDEDEESLSADERKMVTKMEHAAELVKEICGYQHPETAEVFAQVALMYSVRGDLSPVFFLFFRHSKSAASFVPFF